MKIKKQLLVNSAGLLFVILFVSIWTISPALSYPVTFVDSSGKTITINKKPEKVVSIVPSVTEILFKVGAGDTVKAVTYHDSCPGEPGSTLKQIPSPTVTTTSVCWGKSLIKKNRPAN
ncbi:MAG: hypothetical protein JRF62_13725 [Deltaproteobacteria bacterium]|nr:hypothetical protein [Deltaproteobacteria bacterium]